MSTMKIIVRLASIQRIIDDPNAPQGERDTAQSKLQELLAKYNIAPESIKQSPKKDYVFKYQHRWEKDLLCQIIYKTLQVNRFDYFVSYTPSGSKRREIEIELTESEYETISSRYEKYSQLYKQELDDFFSAFLHKHHLFAPKTHGDEISNDIDWDRIERLMQMMAGLRSLPMDSNLLEG